jgi:hypothetical protein
MLLHRKRPPPSFYHRLQSSSHTASIATTSSPLSVPRLSCGSTRTRRMPQRCLTRNQSPLGMCPATHSDVGTFVELRGEWKIDGSFTHAMPSAAVVAWTPCAAVLYVSLAPVVARCMLLPRKRRPPRNFTDFGCYGLRWPLLVCVAAAFFRLRPPWALFTSLFSTQGCRCVFRCVSLSAPLAACYAAPLCRSLRRGLCLYASVA